MARRLPINDIFSFCGKTIKWNNKKNAIHDEFVDNSEIQDEFVPDLEYQQKFFDTFFINMATIKRRLDKYIEEWQDMTTPCCHLYNEALDVLCTRCQEESNKTHIEILSIMESEIEASLIMKPSTEAKNYIEKYM